MDGDKADTTVLCLQASLLLLLLLLMLLLLPPLPLLLVTDLQGHLSVPMWPSNTRPPLGTQSSKQQRRRRRQRAAAARARERAAAAAAAACCSTQRADVEDCCRVRHKPNVATLCVQQPAAASSRSPEATASRRSIATLVPSAALPRRLLPTPSAGLITDGVSCCSASSCWAQQMPGLLCTLHQRGRATAACSAAVLLLPAPVSAPAALCRCRLTEHQ